MEKTLQVYLPYPKSQITQRFGENANGSYARDGLKGHTAYDWGGSWGSPIPNCTKDAYCYSLMNKDDPDPTRYRAVLMISDTEAGTYEISYGHCSEILAKVGQTYQPGDIIAKMGNTGDVFTDHEVTKQERLNGSKAGTHLQAPQIRVVKKTMFSNKYDHYLTLADGSKFTDKAGYFYAVPNYNNGYNGCVSLRDFSTETLATSYKAPPNPSDIIVAQTQASITQISSLPKEQQLPLVKKLLSMFTDFLKSFS